MAMEIARHKARSIFDRYHIVSEGDLKEGAERLDVAFEAQTMTKTMTIDGSEVSLPILSH